MRATLRSAYWEVCLAFQVWVLAAKLRLLRAARSALGLPRRASYHSVWTIRHRDARGRLVWAQVAHNMLHDEGEKFVLEAVFPETQSIPAAYYIGLDNRTSLAEEDTLASLSGEPTGNGYSRKAVNSDATDMTLSQVSGDWRVTTKTVTFTASGGSIGPVTKAFLCNVATGSAGKLLQSNALSQSRTLASGESLDVNMYLGLSE